MVEELGEVAAHECQVWPGALNQVVEQFEATAKVEGGQHGRRIDGAGGGISWEWRRE
jgi:hypothetical protein